MKNTEPHLMTTPERLGEIAGILATAILRQMKRTEREASGEDFTGLLRQPKRPCREPEDKEKP